MTGKKNYLFIVNFTDIQISFLIMRSGIKILFLIFLLFGGNTSHSYSQETENVMIIIIDGARYSETFGDPTHQYIPEMHELSNQGTIIHNFYNDGITYTASAIPALWCGAWTDVRDTLYNGSWTSYAVKPTIFEYFRKQKNQPPEKCYYILKYIPDLWLPSFDPDYGPEYWPVFLSNGNSDDDVAFQTEYVMDTFHPHFLLVYLADVDHEGHGGSWAGYTNAIENADQIVGKLWYKIQSDPFYANNTTMIVTNDHGRHDDQHGGFTGHGCGCEGCRHIQFLALGPNIKSGFVSSQNRYIPDMAVTASHLLGINPDKATGEVMHEILNPSSVNEHDVKTVIVSIDNIYPNPFEYSSKIKYQLKKDDMVLLKIYDITGMEVKTLINEFQIAGEKDIQWDASDNNGAMLDSGLYPFILKVNNSIIYNKLVIIK